MLLKQCFHNIPPEKFQLSFICCPISGIQSDQMKIISDNICTETINSCDLRCVKQCNLTLKMFIIRFLIKRFFYSSRNPLFHLTCRSPCKCHDQESVNIYRMRFICDLAQNSLYKYCCFTRSGSCTDQDIPVPQPDNLLLLFCPLYAHLTLPPCQMLSIIPHQRNFSVCENHILTTYDQTRTL